MSILNHQLFKCSFAHSAAADKAEESNTSSPSVYTVWISLEIHSYLFPPLHSMFLRVVQTSISFNWMKLVWMSLAIKKSAFALPQTQKQWPFSAVIFTRDSCFECGIKERSEDFPSLHTYLSPQARATSLGLCNSKDASSTHVCFSFTGMTPSSVIQKKYDYLHLNKIRMDISKYKAMPLFEKGSLI